MNTTDTEGEEKMIQDLLYLFFDRGEHWENTVSEKVREHLKLYKQSLLTAKDTYWKERVRKIVDIVKYDSCVYQGPYAGHRARGGDELRKILLQSIDNLK